jgi:hypothetical protein
VRLEANARLTTTALPFRIKLAIGADRLAMVQRGPREGGV